MTCGKLGKLQKNSVLRGNGCFGIISAETRKIFPSKGKSRRGEQNESR
jgi:hypothetical protein